MMPTDEGVHVEDHRAFRTYAAVALVIVVAVLNRMTYISNDLAAQLIAILLGLAVAALRYGQVQDAIKVKHALKKQAAVVKEAVLQAAIVEEKHEEAEQKDRCNADPSFRTCP